MELKSKVPMFLNGRYGLNAITFCNIAYEHNIVENHIS